MTGYRQIHLLFARFSFCMVILVSSLYCLLMFIPFTYQTFHKAELLESVNILVRYHPYLYWISLLVLASSLVSELKSPDTRLLTLAFLIIHAIAGIAMVVNPVLARLQNDTYSYVWSLVFPLSLIGVAIIDWRAHGTKLVWVSANGRFDTHTFQVAWKSTFFLTALYFALYCTQHLWQRDSAFGQTETVLALAWSLLSHLALFMLLFLVLHVIGAISGLFSNSSRAEFIICQLFAAFLLWRLLTTVILPPIAFGGMFAEIFGALTGCSVAFYFAGLATSLHRGAGGPIESGLKLYLTPLVPWQMASKISRALALLTIGLLAYTLASRTATLDWNYLLQKTSVAFIWTVTFASFYGMMPGKSKRAYPTALLLIGAILSLGAYITLQASTPRMWARFRHPHTDPQITLERYAGYDVSYQMAKSLLIPARTVSGSFYQFLTQNTNIPRTAQVRPVDIKLVQNLQETPGVKPNIFLIVVDSLRRDFLSPYNKLVTFTPAIERFAKESIVMENAFTRYGGTGLSEPSIWAGGLLLHMQYITPFAPMNVLQKLLECDRYDIYLSQDSILRTVVSSSPSVIELEQNTPTMSLDLCRTLHEVKAVIEKRKERTKPVFVYTQPQNLHISVINREGSTVPAGESYPGFHAPYASRVKKIDQCFGEFIKFLKSRNLYENSIVILTTDHGDSLGEDGRWGHAYTIFPEIVRIPLIIHLPSAMRASLRTDPRAVAFLTDITPTLYYLLGHRPVVRNDILGRPLFAATVEELEQSRQDSHLIVSSYGAVYGILGRDGRQLYISDGINYKDYCYSLTESGGVETLTVSESLKAQNEKLIRERILAINQFYRFGEGQ